MNAPGISGNWDLFILLGAGVVALALVLAGGLGRRYRREDRGPMEGGDER